MSAIRYLTATVTATALLAPVALHADTIIELDRDRETSTFMSNSKKARINTSGKDDYMIVDYASKAFYMVMPGQRQIINLSEAIPSLSSNEPPEIRLAFTPTGSGPVIAGYATESFRFSANGEYCGTLHASRQALNGTGIGLMLDALSELAENHRKSLGGFAAAIPACQQAQLSLASRVDEIGAPLQTINADGQMQSRITKISRDVKVDPGSYELPADYARVSIADKIKDAQQIDSRMDQLQKHAPEMQEMMRQMQQSGHLPPEALEQMQRYQEMIQQQQQQR